MLIISGVLIVLVFLGVAWWLRHSLEKSIQRRFEEGSAKAIRDNLESILALASSTLEEKTKHVHDALEGKEKTFQNLVSEVQSQIKTYQQELKSTEHDRTLKFSEIMTIASRLTQTTEKLSQTLNTNNLRGQWGERIADDILKSVGLIEGVHYQANQQLESNANRPDFTFFLPDEHKVNMDVKFPVANLIKAQETEDEGEQKKYLKDFESDVKNRVFEIAKRDYVNPEENTVDFAILFVPAESIYAAIHQHCRNIFDVAEDKKVILAAPFTLIAILKIILQSFRYFHYEKRLQDMVVLIEKLGDDLSRFKDRFELLDDYIEKLRKAYDEINETSFKKVKSKIAKIEQYKTGSGPSIEASIGLEEKS
ncbi:MAG: hypothetical protein COV74_03570 [Candidatus Omnitrophica bacterium CG11_big_fil_rev_8_21_14_0_20_45_26]|uniref:DNA recombination protein RmuC n=1 Tax=Candidatus Abzuiibacterium crystallinum TaxID=1974748 RepID=A0A2H0LQW5_9BACT|nr:MAG: hypothetical protein COV74_03570 [Candidatus Omnitrophica bacterium CG11_big_fil_rev_8_21_14_0_20_45_26]PIW63515.1 MAG: hypothetical protein COW12_10145 [Candidatus Omnitrophica bacterium CG12_big_fil_rev_8_21_14_0_65_45_16]